MSTFIQDMVAISERILENAQEELQQQRYADAESSASSALDGFMLARDESCTTPRVLAAIQEAEFIILESRKRWAESGQLPSIESVDRLKAEMTRQVTAFSRGLDAAARAAMHGSPSEVA